MITLELKDISESIGGRIAFYWYACGNITQASLAGNIGISQACLSEIERGTADIGINKLIKLATALSVPVNRFIHQLYYETSTGYAAIQAQTSLAEFTQAIEARKQTIAAEEVISILNEKLKIPLQRWSKFKWFVIYSLKVTPCFPLPL